MFQRSILCSWLLLTSICSGPAVAVELASAEVEKLIRNNGDPSYEFKKVKVIKIGKVETRAFGERCATVLAEVEFIWVSITRKRSLCSGPFKFNVCNRKDEYGDWTGYKAKHRPNPSQCRSEEPERVTVKVPVAAEPPAAEPPAADPPALVNGVAISRNAYVAAYARMTKAFVDRGKEVPPGLELRYRTSILRTLMEDELLAQAVKSQGIVISENDIEERVEVNASKFRSKDEFMTYVTQQPGGGLEMYKARIRAHLGVKRLIEQRGPIVVTEEECRAFYESHQDKPPVKGHDGVRPYDEAKVHVHELLHGRKEHAVKMAILFELKAKAKIEPIDLSAMQAVQEIGIGPSHLDAGDGGSSSAK